MIKTPTILFLIAFISFVIISNIETSGLLNDDSADDLLHSTFKLDKRNKNSIRYVRSLNEDIIKRFFRKSKSKDVKATTTTTPPPPPPPEEEEENNDDNNENSNDSDNGNNNNDANSNDDNNNTNDDSPSDNNNNDNDNSNDNSDDSNNNNSDNNESDFNRYAENGKGILVPIGNGQKVNICEGKYINMAALAHEKIKDILISACSGHSASRWILSKVVKYIFKKNP